MSIHARRLADGKVVYVRLRTPDGRQCKRSFASKRDAELFEATDRTDRSRGGWIDPAAGRIPLNTYAWRWLRERSGLRPRTVELYEGLLRLHILPALGETIPARSTPPRCARGSLTSTGLDIPARRRRRRRTDCSARS